MLSKLRKLFSFQGLQSCFSTDPPNFFVLFYPFLIPFSVVSLVTNRQSGREICFTRVLRIAGEFLFLLLPDATFALQSSFPICCHLFNPDLLSFPGPGLKRAKVYSLPFWLPSSAGNVPSFLSPARLRPLLFFSHRHAPPG